MNPLRKGIVLVYIFDIGSVLLYFDPRTFVRTLWKDEARAERLYQTVFQSPEWRLLDEGSVSQEEATLWLCHRNPDDTEHIRLVMRHWLRCLTPRWEVVELLLDMKKQDVRLYFIANISAAGREYLLSTYPFLSVFDGGLFSCDEKMAKPNPALFERLCSKYRLSPEGCVFIDTQKENIQAAEAAGMRGHLFVGAPRLMDTVLW